MIETESQLQLMIDKRRKIDNVTYEQLETHMEELFDKKDYRAFVICYLFLTYGFSNCDMDANITDDINDITKLDNYFVIRDLEIVEYYRKGCFVFSDDDPMFVESIITLFADQQYLLQIEDDRVLPYSIGRITKLATYNKLGEHLYWVVVRKHYSNNVKELCRLARTRGTRLKNCVVL
jgi:hypothetical protein